MLAADHYTDLISKGFQFFGKNSVVFLTFAGICYHHHVEISLYDGLGDIKNVYIIVCKISTNLCNNSYGIVSYYCDDCLFQNSGGTEGLHIRSNYSVERTKNL